MARIKARNATIIVVDTTGASRIISGRANSATLTLSSEAVEVTAFGEEWRTRVGDGIKDWELAVSGFWDGAASQIDSIFWSILSACVGVKFGPGGSDTGMPKYVASGICQDFEIGSEVEGAVTFSTTFVGASTLEASTW